MNQTTVVQSATLRNNLYNVLDSLKERKEFMLVSRKGKLVSAIVDIDFFEDLLALASPSHIKSVKEAREDYKKGRVFTHTEVFGEI